MKPSDILVINQTDANLDEFDGALLRAARLGELPEELADLFTLEIIDGPHEAFGSTFLRRAIINWS